MNDLLVELSGAAGRRLDVGSIGEFPPRRPLPLATFRNPYSSSGGATIMAGCPLDPSPPLLFWQPSAMLQKLHGSRHPARPDARRGANLWHEWAGSSRPRLDGGSIGVCPPRRPWPIATFSNPYSPSGGATVMAGSSLGSSPLLPPASHLLRSRKSSRLPGARPALKACPTGQSPPVSPARMQEGRIAAHSRARLALAELLQSLSLKVQNEYQGQRLR